MDQIKDIIIVDNIALIFVSSYHVSVTLTSFFQLHPSWGPGLPSSRSEVMRLPGGLVTHTQEKEYQQHHGLIGFGPSTPPSSRESMGT